MDDDELLRYSRHILLDEIGIEGQERLRAAHVLVVGAGGLGCAACLYLAAAGVGTLSVVDDDRVDLTNLQRQIAHTTDRVGSPKVTSAAGAMAALNPRIAIRPVQRRVDGAWLDQALPGTPEAPPVNVVVDCTDNFATRHLLNAACVRHGVPLVSGAAVRFDGQLALYDTRGTQAPCYACVFPPESAVEEIACATMGVFAPLVGMIGAAQAADTLAVLLDRADALAGRLRMLDARSMEWTDLRLRRDRDCPVCGDAARGMPREAAPA
ncbi:MAG: molybdopterin-synthase adenylyltransferase MoeB [Pseudomonadota bacterium]